MSGLLLNTDGSIAFSLPPTCTVAPTSNDQLVNKMYTDSHSGGGGSGIDTITLDDSTTVNDGTVSLFLDNGTQAYCKNLLDINSYEAMSKGVVGIVSALKFDSANNLLYVGGTFTIVGQPTIQNLAVWDPSNETWSSLNAWFNPLTSASVLTIELYNGIVYVGGTFTMFLGSSSTNNAAQYDIANNQWSAWGTFLSTVNKIINYNQALYVGGVFAGGLISYDPVTMGWTSIGVSNGIVASNVTDMVVSDNVLYVVGQFNAINTANTSVNAIGIATLSGSVWSGVGNNSVSGSSSSRVAVYGTNVVYISNGRIINLYSNNTWNTIGTSSSTITAAQFSPSGLLYVIGGFSNITNGTNTRLTASNRIAIWNGTSWLTAGGGLGAFTSTIASSVSAMEMGLNGDIYIGGNFVQSNNSTNTTNSIVRLVQSGNPSYSDLYSVSVKVNDVVICESLLRNQSLAIGVSSSGTPYATLCVK